MKVTGSRRFALILLMVVAALTGASVAQAAEDAPVRIAFFTSAACPHCGAVVDTVLVPLAEEHGERLEIKVVDISDPGEPGGINGANYEMLMRAEEMFGVAPEEQGLPMVIVGGEVIIGEDAIRDRLSCLVGDCLAEGGTSWPGIPGLEQVRVGLHAKGQEAVLAFGFGSEESEICTEEDAFICEAPPAIWVAYFYEVGCQECSRAEYDLRYVTDKHPRVVVEEYNVQGDAALAEWLGERSGVPEALRLTTPVLFIGDDYLVGAGITSEALSALVETYAATGGGSQLGRVRCRGGSTQHRPALPVLWFPDCRCCGTDGWTQPVRLRHARLFCLLPGAERAPGAADPARGCSVHAGGVPGLPGGRPRFLQGASTRWVACLRRRAGGCMGSRVACALCWRCSV